MRARLDTADPAANAADALFQRALDFVPAPSRRRPRRRLWCAVGAAAVLADPDRREPVGVDGVLPPRSGFVDE